MKPKEFSDATREYNKQYRALFGYIPSIRDYSCTQEEYITALASAVEEKHEIDMYLLQYEYPLESKVEE